MDLNRLQEAVFGNKERVVTGIAMVAVLAIILAINNFYLMILMTRKKFLIFFYNFFSLGLQWK